ncbi:unnamed protein product [Nippostrongylus brasiliensis]|uniref:Core-binding (CB) domain-containing protein n=1 Tax=Nippostrongylus brasiliensis TaxID=27835 RepID=A0A0N4YCF4_NIPBR|nr:unnamed protein product [Nippostrongylus brasiliensis]
MGEDVQNELQDSLWASRAPGTVNTYRRAIDEFKRWQSEGPLERHRDDLDSAAISLAKKSRSSSSRSLASFVAAFAFDRIGRRPHELQKWAILDDIVRSRRRSEAWPAQKFAFIEEWQKLITTTTLIEWPTWRKIRARLLLSFLFCALMRISEATNLLVNDIIEEDTYWKINIP